VPWTRARAVPATVRFPANSPQLQGVTLGRSRVLRCSFVLSVMVYGASPANHKALRAFLQTRPNASSVARAWGPSIIRHARSTPLRACIDVETTDVNPVPSASPNQPLWFPLCKTNQCRVEMPKPEYLCKNMVISANGFQDYRP
jgi:hypothetical protein